MALSLLQDAQNRGLAAALAGMKREDDCSMKMSPPMTNNTSNLYAGLHPATASALGILSPQLLAANRTAAALMAARLPISTLASVSSLFPHHPALFNAWTQPTTPLTPNNCIGPNSPPASPISPHLSTKKLANNNNNSNSHNNNNNSHNNNNNNNNNNIVSTTCDVPAKKQRRLTVKKDLISPIIHQTHTIDVTNITTGHELFGVGPISPPSSGSSPNSTQDSPALHAPKDPSRDKCFTCKICNRSFGYKHVLQNHERTHTGEKPFECPECHKRFTRDHHLKTHMRLHTGEKPYHCSHCDRQFVQVANLRRHLRVHTGERPYSCDMCEARFSDSNQLKSHMLIHNGEKPFVCNHCRLRFRRRHHLMHHKCGVRTPPSPASSPAISEQDHKSAISSFGSDESSDISKSIQSNQQFDIPLDLSEDCISINGDYEKRKKNDLRHVIRIPKQIVHVTSCLPEQTEPEDLSMRSPHSSHHHDDDFEDLDEAATLYQKHKNFENKQKTKDLVKTKIEQIKDS